MSLPEPCWKCFGSGVRYVDLGDDNDIEVACDECHGSGVIRTCKEEDEANG